MTKNPAQAITTDFLSPGPAKVASKTNAAWPVHLPSMPMKCRVILPFIAMLIFAGPSTAEQVTNDDLLQLWNDCLPINLEVADLSNDEADIDLKKDAITVAVRSRLRAAHLYTDDGTPDLFVGVTVVGAAFLVRFQYSKLVKDSASGLLGTVVTWERDSVGTHGRNASYVLSLVSKYVDKFIDEYLRVNEDACKR